MLLIKIFPMLKREKKVKKKLKKAFFFWSFFDPLSFQDVKNFQKKTQIQTTLKKKIKYFKEFSIHSTFRLLNNNQQVKQKELFLLKQILTNLDIQESATNHLDFCNLERFLKTEDLLSKKGKQESKSFQTLYCLEDFLNV